MKNKIPEIIMACLVQGVKVLPFQIDRLIERNERYGVPYADMIKEDFDLKKYVVTLWYTSDIAHSWTQAHEVLIKDFWFEEIKRTEWHRVFTSLVYKK